MKKNVAGQIVTAMIVAKADGTLVTTGTTYVYVRSRLMESMDVVTAAFLAAWAGGANVAASPGARLA